jgi:phage gpG-like protein
MLEYSVDTSEISRKFSEAEQRLGDATQDPMRSGFAAAGAIYLGFARNRFVKAARGDGTWVPLAESTKLARLRKTKAGKAKLEKTRKKDKQSSKSLSGHYRNQATKGLTAAGNFEILRDTGLLLNSLSSGATGNVLRQLSDGITVGTAIKYAGYHQNPTVPGRPPQRLILVQPDDVTKQRMAAVLNKAVIDTVNQVMGSK